MGSVEQVCEDTNMTAEKIGHCKVSCSKEGKGKRLWKKVKYQLVEYHSLPGYLRDNEFIVGHYRSEWPMKQVLLSIFTIHNETLNVWTHLIGFFIFLSLTIYTAMKVPKVVDLHSLQHIPDVLRKADLHKLHSELMTCLPSLPNMPDLHKLRKELKTTLPSMDLLPSLSGWHVVELLYNCLPERFSIGNHTDVCVLQSVKEDVANIIAPLMVRPITRWPFFAFLGGAMFCLLASSTCHLLSCHSERISYIMLRLDYAGIAALISTSFYPPVYYSFMCDPFFSNLYMGFITVLGVATILFSLLPVFQNPEFRSIRASLFFGMGVSGIAPILHKLILFWHQPEALHTTGYEVLMGFLYGIGALVYATRIPERWMPGKFDIAGHSHQLFHILVVAGAYTHYRAGLVYLKWRDLNGC
ncbi:heptahelical transmembrane protein 4 isoform X1 [Durio zibethinus]|uniref:Heptahelical transmembrane protein 4 isoform X1 n=5 Tax=Durio zibethinus TaxID=66656 RepID=A0A6P5ZFA9_DURZI|nr:heptahelical transmembrane protein 4 isoform X1 [Durio zibethinus]XP_022751183.1 heptahelical transmembrane protein 4 isoform X1 [Durio zibethinus]XP_022751184.1 heptahelical transmembrane protein 4 isoform X1 [Durio zibethinus]XP_022751185.1 heptahelical transmembrane protein 4 isoform X1 [Durio zibethinus]XP_022751186.1 heptahelical transmembrane protein 4 isoform X1 [Durio zibethinus]